MAEGGGGDSPCTEVEGGAVEVGGGAVEVEGRDAEVLDLVVHCLLL